MAHDLNLELGQLLDRYDENRREVEERMRQAKRDEDDFEQGFADLRTRVIRPVFDATGAILKSRGHEFSISENELGKDSDGKTTEAAISIRVMPAGMAKPTHGDAQFPLLSFITRHYNKTVCILASNAAPKSSGFAGTRGDYQMAQVDTALVEGELLDLIAGIVKT